MVSVGAASTSSWPTDGRTDNERRNDMYFDDKKKVANKKRLFSKMKKKKIKRSFVRVRYFIFFSLEERGEESPLFAPHTSSSR